MVVGGIAGPACFVGLDACWCIGACSIRASARTSSVGDIAILLMLCAQLALGLLDHPVSAQHLDGAEMVKFMAGRRAS